MAVVGIGATGSVLAAALLSRDPETLLVGSRPQVGEVLKRDGIRISGALARHAPVRHFTTRLDGTRDFNPNLIFLCTKTFSLPQVLGELKAVARPGTKIVSTQNGLGTEDLIAEEFGPDAAFRMTLNYGVALKTAGQADVAFFNKPNHLGSVTESNRELGLRIGELLTEGGLDTEFVEDIKLYVWKKMVMKCTMASICAVTDRTIKGAIEFPPTREIAEACFGEVLAVAKAMGYDLGDDYLGQALGYLEKVGAHKDSMCDDIAHERPTEIDFLGGKVVEYGRSAGIPTPCYATMTNLVKAIEDSYLPK
jgi:2-dehydropantoate 2-reductase